MHAAILLAPLMTQVHSMLMFVLAAVHPLIRRPDKICIAAVDDVMLSTGHAGPLPSI